MATRIPLVTVSRTEADGFLIRCEHCPQHRTLRPTRHAADEHATAHQASHGTPNTEDVA